MGEKKIESFIMYCEWEGMFAELDKSDREEIFMAIFAYVNRGELPSFPKGSGASIAFRTVKSALDNNRQKYEEKCKKNQQNAKKSHKQTQANGSERKRTVAKQYVRYHNDNDNYNDNETDNDNEYEYDSETDNDNECASLLTPKQRDDLVGLSSVSSVETYISKIMEWQQENGKTCKKPYETIKKWIEQDKAKGIIPGEIKKQSSIDLDEYEQFAKSYDFANAPWNKGGST